MALLEGQALQHLSTMRRDVQPFDPWLLILGLLFMLGARRTTQAGVHEVVATRERNSHPSSGEEPLRKRLQNMSIDVDRIPSTPWEIDSSITAELDLAPLAEALTLVVRERFGAALVYPDLKVGITRIRVEWQLDRKRRYWWRLGLVLNGTPGRPPSLSAYVGPGDAHRVGTITANEKEIAAISREFDEVLAAAADRVHGTTGSQRVLFYLELNGPWSVKRDTALPSFSAEILASMVVRPNEACVSAVIVTVRDGSRIAARERALPIIAELAALLTLITGAPVSGWHRHPAGFLHPVMAPQRRGTIYPRRFFRPDPAHLRRDFSQQASVTAELIRRMRTQDRDVVKRMLFAYSAGRDVHQRQPTIAAVAYLAVLAAGLKEERCESAVCGAHGVAARHPLRGERDQIIERLCPAVSLSRRSATSCGGYSAAPTVSSAPPSYTTLSSCMTNDTRHGCSDCRLRTMSCQGTGTAGTTWRAWRRLVAASCSASFPPALA